MHAVGAADARRVLELARAAHQHAAQAFHAGGEQHARVADLERERGVEHVARGEPVVDVARVGADLLGERGGERDHIVTDALLDLGDARRIDGRLRADHLERCSRDQSALRVHLAHRELHREPARVLPLVGEDPDHFGSRVAFDHVFLFFARLRLAARLTACLIPNFTSAVRTP